MLFLVACGPSAPGVINRPPADPAELVTALEDLGWEAHYIEEANVVFARRASHTEEEFENLSESARVWVENVAVMYFANEAEAITAYNRMREEGEAEMGDIPNTITVNHSISRYNNTVSSWSRMAGRMSDLDDFFNIDFDAD